MFITTGLNADRQRRTRGKENEKGREELHKLQVQYKEGLGIRRI